MFVHIQVLMLEKLVKELPDLLQRNTDLLTGDHFETLSINMILEYVLQLCMRYIYLPRE